MENSRDKFIQFRLSESELESFEKKFQASKYKSKSDFIRAMIWSGLIVNVNDELLKDFQRKLSALSNNTNQIAKRINGTDNIYAEDIAEIRNGVEEVRQLLKSFLLPLQNPRHLPISQVLKKQETEN